MLRTAVANAEANHGLIGDELVIVAAYADEGPTIKRFRPRARGRVNRIFKRTCHITIRLAEAPEQSTPAPQARGREGRAAAEGREAGAATTKTRTRRKKKEVAA